MLLWFSGQKPLIHALRFTRSHVRYKHMEKIVIKPVKSLVTDQVSICGEGFQPETPITIKASISCNAERLFFMSHGHFTTSSNGSFDLSTTESVGGTYNGIDPMGLFWTMKKTGTSIDRFNINDSTTILTYVFEVFHGHHEDMDWCIVPVCSTTIERCFLANNVKRAVINDEIYGNLFIPPGKGPFPAVIVMYGGTKRGQLFEDAAAILANNGFVTLCLGYYAVAEHLPKSYANQDIRIEYFEKAVDYLSSLKSVKGDAIGVLGMSTGGTIGVAMAAFLPQIKCVAWVNGFICGMGAPFTYKDKCVDAYDWSLAKVGVRDDGCLEFHVSNPEEQPSILIPFENSSADFLFVVGLDDANANLHADVAKKRMDGVEKTNYKINKYPKMGHLLDAPFMPVNTNAGHPLIPKGARLYYGGDDKKMHTIQQQKVWKDIISFCKESLSTSEPGKAVKFPSKL